MAKISFYLTNPKTKNETNLFCLINYGLYKFEKGAKKYLPLKYYTDITMFPNLWNKDLNRAKESNKWANPETFDISIQAVKESAKKNYNAINSKIESFEKTVKDLIEILTNNGNPPSLDTLKNELNKIYKPDKVIDTTLNKTPKELFQFIDFLIETSLYRYNTKRNYKSTKNWLLNYQKENNIKLTFGYIDIDFYNNFVSYLKNKNLAINTIGTHIKIIKTFLNEANERGIIVPTDYKKKSFRKPNEETTSIYLNESELMQMYNKSGLPLYLERVRDLFLIGCYTGLRFSDLIQLKKENITADNTINVTTQKTNQKVVVPIHPIVREILKKYDYKLPKLPTNQKFNEFLKEVAKLAKIKEPITIESTKGGFKVSETTEKYNLVTSHTARRSFATNAFLMDMPSISIMKITGHRTEASFMRYIKMSAKDNAIKMQSHKFFNPMLIAK